MPVIAAGRSSSESSGAAAMIPKRLHYVWVGGPFPARYQAHVDGWRRLHPDWEITRWSEANIDLSHPLIAKAYRLRKWSTVADIARLMAVHGHGGIYLDTDIEVLQPLDSLLRQRCFLAFQGTAKASDLVANGCFGAVAGHWFIGEALQAVLRLRPIPFGLDRPTRYGPKLITRLLRRHGLRQEAPDGVDIGDIRILPAPVFFPYPYGAEFTPACIRDTTLAVHWWDRSWAKDLPLPVRMAQAVKRRVEQAWA
jgi:hypothetical protein